MDSHQSSRKMRPRKLWDYDKVDETQEQWRLFLLHGTGAKQWLDRMPATTGAVCFAAKTENRLAAVNHRMRLFGAHATFFGVYHGSEHYCLKLIVLFVVAPRTTSASMPATPLQAPTHPRQWLPNELKQISQSCGQLQFTLYTGRLLWMSFALKFLLTAYFFCPARLYSLTFAFKFLDILLSTCVDCRQDLIKIQVSARNMRSTLATVSLTSNESPGNVCNCACFFFAVARSPPMNECCRMSRTVIR